MANFACNGCNVLIDGRDMNNVPHSGHLATGYNLVGNGYGSLTGISNALLGSINLYYTNATDGGCATYTGSVYNTGNGGSGWTSNPLTGCTGLVGCSSNLQFYFVPNNSLFSQFSGSTVFFSVTSFSNQHVTGLNITSGQTVPGGPPAPGFVVAPSGVVQDCGTLSWYTVEARWTAGIGASGYLYGTTGHRVECTYCSQYEIVAL